MKDSNTTSLTIRAKVSSNLNNSISSLPPLVRTKLTDKSTNSATNSINSSNQHNNSTNSDDEVDIDRLIIDLDADIEKSNDKLSSESESHFTPSTTSTNSTKIMSSTVNKTKDLNNGTNTTAQINQSTTSSNSTASNLSKTNTSSGNSNSSSSQNTNLQTSSTGGDKGLKMKIQRKSSGGRFAGELKSEIVQSDSLTSSRHTNSSSNLNFKTEKNGLTNSNSLTNNLTTTSSNSTPSTPNDNDKEKIKHSSSKNKNGSHKEKKAKKDKNPTSIPKNGNELTQNLNSNSNSNGEKDQSSSVVLSLDKKVHNSNSNDHLSFNNQINQLKRENDSLDSPPFKKSKTDDIKKEHNLSSNNSTVNNTNNKPKVEMRSVSTSTSVSTMTDPECLGFCEPGSAICLEGITWVEAEGVLVVNVTWRGKSYVGTLLDCTKHDWGPPHPRLCDSPTSDLESKGLKSGRGKRTRTSISEQDSRLFQSKLRNGKGRRNFTVPASPIKVDQNKRNRNGTNSNNKDNLETKSTNSQPASSRDTPTLIESSSITNSPLSKQPNSPQLIECPEPNCSKKYKHVNGLKYHQSHCHSGTNYLKGDELLDDMCKGSNAEDAEEMDVEDQPSVNSPKSKSNAENSNDCNENVAISNQQNAKQCDNEISLVKKTDLNCNNKDDCREEANSPSAFSDISDVNENSNSNENELDKSNSLSNKCSSTDQIKLEEDELSLRKLSNLENLQKNKESESIKSENKQIKDDKLNDKEDQINKTINGADKNGLANNQSPLLNPPPAALNPNFPFNPFNRLPTSSHYPLPMDPAIQAYLMNQERFLDEQQQQPFQMNLNNFNNDLKNSMQHKPPHNNRFSPQASQQSSIFNQASNTQNQHNKGDTSPYDFIQHEKQREESLKLASNKNAFGNLSSPKQQPSLVAQHLLNQQQQHSQNSSLTSNMKEEQRTTPKHNANKQEENIKPPTMDLMKPTSESCGPPSTQPNHSFYHSMPPFLPGAFPPSSFGQAPNSFDPQVLRAVTSNPFNQNFINNLRFPNSLPGGPQLPIPTSLPGNPQELNNKLMSGFNGNKIPFEMLQQYNLKEMQDHMLNISPNSAKNGLPVNQNQINNTRQPNQMPDLYGALINKAHNLQK